MSEKILQMKSITKHFPGVLALDKANLEVDKGEVHIIVGENGAGKSTLMKILSGALKKDGGSIFLNGQLIENLSPKVSQELGISIIYQEFNLIPSLSVAENIFIGRESEFQKIPGKISWNKMYDRANEILGMLNLDLDVKTIVKNLSVAQQQMIEIAKALSINAKIIIMDEPTAALSKNEIKNLFENIRGIKETGVSIIYISHRLEEFKEIGDRVTVMRDGKTIATIPICEAHIRELIRLMVGRDINEKYPKADIPKGKVIFEVSGLSRKNILKDISFSLRQGEILGVSGLMGAGRTELARAIFGVDEIDKGSIYLDGEIKRIKSPKQAIKSGIGFLTEDRKSQGLVLKMGVGENITLANVGLFTNGIHINLKKEAKSIKEYIKLLNIKTPRADQKAQNLSGGNQQKVVIAKWLMTKSKVFIFDEPTRGIDVGAKIEVYNLMNRLIQNGAGIILISSELPELLGMSDRIIVLCRGEINAEMDVREADQEKLLYFAAGGGKYIE